jgi:hypothetical protein
VLSAPRAEGKHDEARALFEQWRDGTLRLEEGQGARAPRALRTGRTHAGQQHPR